MVTKIAAALAPVCKLMLTIAELAAKNALQEMFASKENASM
jgi:hypothetical protein